MIFVRAVHFTAKRISIMVSGGFFLDFVFEKAIVKSSFPHASRRLIVSSLSDVTLESITQAIKSTAMTNVTTKCIFSSFN